LQHDAQPHSFVAPPVPYLTLHVAFLWLRQWLRKALVQK